MGQCSSSRQTMAEPQVRPQLAAAGVVDAGHSKREQPLQKGAVDMNQPFTASSQEELVLMVSLDSITKIY